MLCSRGVLSTGSTPRIGIGLSLGLLILVEGRVLLDPRCVPVGL